MTHHELVQRAARWLKGSRGCYVVFTEKGSRGEMPDAIGWIGRWSILIECKITIADFRADKYKKCRQVVGMGQERYYMTPPGLLPSKVDLNGWGLLECRPNIIKTLVSKKPPKRTYICEPDPLITINEVAFLVNHWGHKAYEIPYNPLPKSAYP